MILRMEKTLVAKVISDFNNSVSGVKIFPETGLSKSKNNYIRDAKGNAHYQEVFSELKLVSGPYYFCKLASGSIS